MKTISIYSEDVSANGKIYQIGKTFQVLTGKTKDLSINVEEYVGTLTVNVEDDLTSDPIANAGVKLIRNEDYQDYYSGNYSDVISYAVFSGNTNSNGQVIFTDVPTDYYYAMTYHSSDSSLSSFRIVTSYEEEEFNLDL